MEPVLLRILTFIGACSPFFKIVTVLRRIDEDEFQKVAVFKSVPCITLCNEAGRVKLVECFRNRLCPPLHAGQIDASFRATFGTDGLVIASFGRGDAFGLIKKKLKDVLA